MSATSGTRHKATAGQIRRYYNYRDLGLTVEDAARAAGNFKKTWGYERDAERRQQEQAEKTVPEFKGASLEDAVDFLVSPSKRAQDLDNPADMLSPVQGITFSLALERAVNLQNAFEALFCTEDWLEEFKAKPITWQEVLESFKTQRQLEDDYAFWPARLDTYVNRYAEKYGGTMKDEIDESMIRNPRTMEVLKELSFRIEDGLTPVSGPASTITWEEEEEVT